MKTMNDHVAEYTRQLQKGQIQQAFKGIMTFMSGLRKTIGKTHPEYSLGAVYFGYMDMTYFALVPEALKKKNLKIAIVYLHEQNKFEAWLAGGNRRVQAEYIGQLKQTKLEKYQLSQVSPGVDSIVEYCLVEQPDFNRDQELMEQIQSRVDEFIRDILPLLGE